MITANWSGIGAHAFVVFNFLSQVDLSTGYQQAGIRLILAILPDVVFKSNGYSPYSFLPVLQLMTRKYSSGATSPRTTLSLHRSAMFLSFAALAISSDRFVSSDHAAQFRSHFEDFEDAGSAFEPV